MPAKRINRSKLQRQPRPRVVEFEMTFVAVGAGCGVVAAVAFETATRPHALYMFIGAVIGMALGGAAEVGRLWWRKRQARKGRPVA